MTNNSTTTKITFKYIFIVSFFLFSVLMELGAISSTISYAVIKHVSSPNPDTMITNISIGVPCVVHDWRVNCQNLQMCLGIYCTRYASCQANVSLLLLCDQDVAFRGPSYVNCSSNIHSQTITNEYNNFQNYSIRTVLTLSQPLYSIPPPSPPKNFNSTLWSNVTTCYLRQDQNIFTSPVSILPFLNDTLYEQQASKYTNYLVVTIIIGLLTNIVGCVLIAISLVACCGIGGIVNGAAIFLHCYKNDQSQWSENYRKRVLFVNGRLKYSDGSDF
ncbi:hypothetical protein C9374_010786 [Naegleria lovaniensis]|uniref:Uncharacterized protein n=1 Tax=Naegleria lovaniensis TaxID=51637 RepID=A0AA88GF79_NAELO|nr:uncharacterized protein C9374_010786 [Naegleria lovaniensis]KAG2374502.1 hypothetical protein C9374_010786 [Naegleria lovaniensis]